MLEKSRSQVGGGEKEVVVSTGSNMNRRNVLEGGGFIPATRAKEFRVPTWGVMKEGGDQNYAKERYTKEQ